MEENLKPWRRPTFPPPKGAVSSAMPSLASGFGMDTGRFLGSIGTRTREVKLPLKS